MSEGRPKREAKAVEQLSYEVKEKSELEIKSGSGEKLGDLDNVKANIDKLNAGGEELKTLHRLCFGRPGEKTKIKRNLREFSGDDDIAGKEATVSKLDGKLIKAVMSCCDLSTTGTKAQNVEALLAFLAAPAASGKAAKAGSKKRAAPAAKKGKAAKAKKTGPAAGLKRPLTAFFLYSNNKRDKVRAENPEASVGEIAKILGEKWKGISDERRVSAARPPACPPAIGWPRLCSSRALSSALSSGRTPLTRARACASLLAACAAQENYVAQAAELKKEYEKKKAALEVTAAREKKKAAPTFSPLHLVTPLPPSPHLLYLLSSLSPQYPSGQGGRAEQEEAEGGRRRGGGGGRRRRRGGR